MKFKKGTIVTCERGHEICEFSRDIYSDSMVQASDFINFREENITRKPKAHDRIGHHRCNCGKNWIRYKWDLLHGGVEVHITDEGWK